MIGTLLALFNPLKWYEKIVSVVTTLAVLSGLVWWGWSALGNHFTEAQDAEYARVEQVARDAKQFRDSINEANTKKANDEKIKRLEAIAADSLLLAAAHDRLQNDLRARAAAETDIAACVQRARALDHVQQAVGDFAQRVVTAADRHVADKVACTAAWPK
jgi:hypothetical protein